MYVIFWNHKDFDSNIYTISLLHYSGFTVFVFAGSICPMFDVANVKSLINITWQTLCKTNLPCVMEMDEYPELSHSVPLIQSSLSSLIN